MAEVAADMVKAGVAAVPLVGGAAVELFDLVLEPSLQKRRDEWLRHLGQVVDELRHRLEGFDPRDLEGNEEFVSAVLAASVVAVKSHDVEKLRMLRNALVNSVLPGAPEEYERMSFLRFIDELMPLHVRMLALLDDPGKWFDDHGLQRPQFGISSSVVQVIEGGLPEVRGRRDIYDQVGADLEQRTLAQGSFHGMMTATGAWASRSSERGKRFLKFISLPGEAVPGYA